MATLRDNLLPTFQNVARKKPEELGLRTNVVKLRWRTYTGGADGPAVDLGTYTDVDITISPAPKLTHKSNMMIDTVVTPAFAGGGYTPEQLNPSTAQLGAGVDHFWVIVSPDGVERLYKVVDFNQRRAFGYYVTLEPVDRTAAF